MSDTPTEVDADELTGVLTTPHWLRGVTTTAAAPRTGRSTVAERRARGKAARREVPRSTHERDHAALVRAIQDGRVAAEAGA